MWATMFHTHTKKRLNMYVIIIVSHMPADEQSGRLLRYAVYSGR